MKSKDTDLSAARRLWMSQAFSENLKGSGARILSSHALLLEIDIGYAFSAGAWISTIVLACAAVEAKIRQVDKENYVDRLRVLIEEDEELKWLIEIRNEIMHSREPGSKSKFWKANPNDLGECHAVLETDARRAISVMFKSLYGEQVKPNNLLR